MITLRRWKTSDGCKPAIMLEEVGFRYEARGVYITADAQFDSAFLKLASNKTPALVDHDGPSGQQTLFESGAILTYLARRSGRLYPSPTSSPAPGCTRPRRR